MENPIAFPDLPSKISRMEALASQCRGTGIYESRLGTFYSEAGRLEDARKLLLSGLTHNTAYSKELRLGLFYVDFRQEKMTDAEKQASSLLSDFPTWAGSYNAIAQVQLLQGRFQEAVQNLEHANQLEADAGTYALLTMAYYKLGRPKDAVVAMQHALRLNRSLVGHTQAVCATVYSLVALGYIAEADDLLTKHLRVKPEAASDPTFIAASGLVASEKQKVREPSVPGG